MNNIDMIFPWTLEGHATKRCPRPRTCCILNLPASPDRKTFSAVGRGMDTSYLGSSETIRDTMTRRKSPKTELDPVGRSVWEVMGQSVARKEIALRTTRMGGHLDLIG